MPRDDWARARAKDKARNGLIELDDHDLALTNVECPKCHSFNNRRSSQTFKNGTTHIRCECAACGMFIQYLPQN